MPSQRAAARDHLFISYAVEDRSFARWLALRLTAEGYKIWIDQFELLGRESWPQDIDAAIKTRTFRMLGLLSRHSIAKPNPVKERALALSIAKQPGRQGFLIPLNVDGLAATELDWLSSDITFIPFATSWASGLVQLIKLLDRENCPKSANNGRSISRAAASSSEIVLHRPDLVTSNVYRFLQVPAHVTTFVVNPQMDYSTLPIAQRDWAFCSTSPHRVLAFHAPPDNLAKWLRPEAVQSTDWRSTPLVEKVNSTSVVTELLRRAIETRLHMCGFAWSPDIKAFYFQGPLGGDIRVAPLSGRKTTVQASGQRTYFRIGQPKVPYRYRLAAKLSIGRGLFSEFSLLVRLRLYFTDTEDAPLPPSQQQSRRKHLTRSWFNRHWLMRHLAVIQHITDDSGLICVGPEASQQVILDGLPISFTAAKTIDETKLEQLEEIGDEVPLEEVVEDDDDATDTN